MPLAVLLAQRNDAIVNSELVPAGNKSTLEEYDIVYAGITAATNFRTSSIVV